jgi:hypothetical protein
LRLRPTPLRPRLFPSPGPALPLRPLVRTHSRARPGSRGGRRRPPWRHPSGRGGSSRPLRSEPARKHATGSAQRQYPWLRGALVKLAHDDPDNRRAAHRRADCRSSP